MVAYPDILKPQRSANSATSDIASADAAGPAGGGGYLL